MNKLHFSLYSLSSIALLYSPYVLADTDKAKTDPITIQSPTLQPTSVNACVAISANAQRLECYDALFRLDEQQKQQVFQEQQSEKQFVSLVKQANLDENATLKEKIAHNWNNTELFSAGDDFNPNISFLDRHWELSPDSKLGTWNIHTYQPTYALPLFVTTDKNTMPHSENPLNTVTTAKNYDSLESKFQLSLKTKAVENIFGDNGDLWLGYTQSSRWQVYNGEESRPFRETNYEPEAMLMFRTNYNVLGLNARLLGVGFNHQSNGSSDPFSRSWNRVTFHAGFEKNNFALMLRPWIRIPETKDKDDNNPNIENYMGQGDLTAYYQHNQHNFALMLRHSLKGGNDSHGAVQFDWTFPIHGKLRGHFQVFDGYGESLIDYNHRATYFGLGVSLTDGF